MKTGVHPGQLTSDKPADLDLHCLQNRTLSRLSIAIVKGRRKIFIFCLPKKLFIFLVKQVVNIDGLFYHGYR